MKCQYKIVKNYLQIIYDNGTKICFIVTVQTQAWHSLSSYAPRSGANKISAPCIADAFKMGWNSLLYTVSCVQ